ncbi:MAG: chemotaxis protein CheA, partial [Methylocystaceae bacterium]|nr:chemotaxis protein CheA [Methylocystaceae bacterium]
PEPEPQEDSAEPAVEEAVETDQSEETETRPSEAGMAHYRIQFVPDSHLLRFANEPLLLSRELATLGQCYVYADVSKLPSLDDIKADEAYLSWIFELVSDCKLADIEEVFEFVIDDCDLKIDKMEASVKPESGNEDTVADKAEPSPLKLAGPSPLEVAGEKTPVVKKETQKSEGPSVSSSHKVSSIRVDLDRVDKLVNMVGELVISQAMLMQQAENLPNNVGETMSQGFENLSAHTRHLQESVMAIRMQPVKSVFARMPRLVRELSARLKKKVDLITSGEMTEVDKTVIEQLMDPITHMIRNSLDHGVESVEERIAAGKPERATIQLNAEHRSGRIQIEVIDDGYGIDRKQVLEKAIAKGIVDQEDNLRDDEIDDLIFVPGFSTAKEVSNISGRGVGMDVVRRNIVNLGGRISVFSSPGKGTRFLLSLPLTLAVLDGMIVKCGDEKYIIPLTSIIENIYPQPEELKKLGSGATLISVRGEYIRLVNLHRLFNIKGAITDPVEGLVVIVETERYGLVGILVDELLGQQQVVIKSLEENYDPIAGVSAATILGNGKVALILDTDGLAQMEHGNSRRNFNELSKQVLLTGERTNDVE